MGTAGFVRAEEWWRTEDVPQRLKPGCSGALMARLKPCPFEGVGFQQPWLAL